MLCLARAPGGLQGTPVALSSFDENWLLSSTTVGATITLCILIVTYLLGDDRQRKMVNAKQLLIIKLFFYTAYP